MMGFRGATRADSPSRILGPACSRRCFRSTRRKPIRYAEQPRPSVTLLGFPAFWRTVVARKLAKSTVQRFQKRLEEEKTRLEALIQEYERELEVARLTESSSDRSSDPGNAEASSMKMEYAKELSIEQNTVDLLSKVNHALDRVADGDYGICEACARPIPVMRLGVLPYSTLCVKCAATPA